MSDGAVKTHAKNQLNEKAPRDFIMHLKITGIDSIKADSEGRKITALPTIVTQAGVRVEAAKTLVWNLP
jgi:hypothetical protein